MVEISLSGSGEGPGRVTGRGYSTVPSRAPGSFVRLGRALACRAFAFSSLAFQVVPVRWRFTG
jgi:hypothetical protein